MLRRLLVVLVVAALLLAVPTAAVTSTEDDAGAITMEPYDGPNGNGQYAFINSSGDLEVEFEKLNADAITTAHNVFNITAEATCAEVWVEVDGVTAYLGDDPSTPIDSAENAVELSANETISVGFQIVTGDSAPDTDSMTIHATDCSTAGGGDGGDTDGGDTDDDGTTDDDGGEPTATPTGSAEFEFAVSAKNGSAAGRSLIAVKVTNTGDATGTTTVSPTVNGTTAGEETVTLGPGESTTVTFVYRASPGTYRVEVGGVAARFTVAEREPLFRVTSLSAADSTVGAGNATRVVATVENVGSQAGTYTAVLTDNGSVVARQTVTVPAGESREVTVRPTFDEPGVHLLAVGEQQTTVRVTGVGNVRILGASVRDDRIQPGNATTFSVTLENRGRAPAERTLDVVVAGVVVDTLSVRVPAGETKTVTVERQFDAPGVYTVAFDDVTAGEVVVAEGDATTDRLLQTSLGVVVMVPLLVGLLLALWRRRLFDALAQAM